MNEWRTWGEILMKQSVVLKMRINDRLNNMKIPLFTL